MKRPPRNRGRASKPCLSIYREKLTDQSESYLWRGVGLRQHGSTGLDEDTESGKSCRFGSDVCVDDPAVCSLEIGLVDAQHFRCELQLAGLGAVGRTQVAISWIAPEMAATLIAATPKLTAPVITA